MKIALNPDRVIAILCGLVGGFWAYSGWFNYGFWVNKGPGPGFIPVIIGIVTCILAAVQAQNYDKEAEPVDVKAILPIAAMIAFTISVSIIGFLPTVFLFLVLWLITQGSYSRTFAVSLAAIATGLIWGIFEYWLQVPFPGGLIKSLL
ncbi:tripartite tricarboxylate transporter TctB family protein [Sporomusa sp. GT1]|uniref:DUF1468 domain-containing protein n=1 Tax=uncultured Sporomusa sp. TaxID=307249 RepID=A0A212M0I0_9FIRM|nr:tripartite tricarboxylate transporter TctB family protein [Sporomusa sp. GT1]SCM83288.1 conserved membrane hypothetical protein [uncultured Sporomusa sp.]